MFHAANVEESDGEELFKKSARNTHIFEKNEVILRRGCIEPGGFRCCYGSELAGLAMLQGAGIEFAGKDQVSGL